MTAEKPGIELADYLDAEERSALVELLHVLHEDEAAVKPVNEAITKNRDRLKRWHELYPEDQIADLERGYVAQFTERNKGDETDLIALAEHHPNASMVLVKLAQAGILRANVTMLKALAGKSEWADAALKFTHTSGTNTVLKIEKVS